MLATGNFRWNAGTFLISAEAIIRAFREHAPALYEAVLKSVEAAQTDLGFTRLDEGAWSKADDISIDYAIMEKAQNLAVMPFDAGWSNLGG